MVKKRNEHRQTYTKNRHMQSFGNNLAQSGQPEHTRYDIHSPSTRYAMAQDLAVADEEKRYLTDPGPQHPRPTRVQEKVPSRLPKARQQKLNFKPSPPKPKRMHPMNKRMLELGVDQAKATQARKDAEQLDVEKFLRPNGQVAQEPEEEKDFPWSLNNPFFQDAGKTNSEVLSYSMQSGSDHQAASSSEVNKKRLACMKCHKPSNNDRDFQRHRAKCMPDYVPKKGRPPVANEHKARPSKGYEERGKPVQFQYHAFKVSVIRQKLTGVTRKLPVFDVDQPRRWWSQGTDVGDKLFELARKQKMKANKTGFQDDDVDTDQECVDRNKKWMNAELKETIEDFICDPNQEAFEDIVFDENFNRNRTRAVFQHVSQDADNEQDDRSVTPTFAASLRDVICESEEMFVQERFGSVLTSQLAQPFTSHEGSVPPSLCAFSGCYKQSQDDQANGGHSHAEWVQNLHYTELAEAWEKGELQGPGNFGQY